jgi:hypothetical protein
MPTFAEELNDKKCLCGIEEGCPWFSDDNGNEVTEVGGYFIEQQEIATRIPVVAVEFLGIGEKYVVCGLQGAQPYWAVFDPDAPAGKKWCDVT